MPACTVGHLVHAEEASSLPPEATLLAMSVHSGATATLSLCRDADYASCVTIGPYTDADPVRVYAIEPGSYCLLDVLYELPPTISVHQGIEPDRAHCLDVRAGVITYPGDAHLVVTPAHQQGMSVRMGIVWDVRADFDDRFVAAYPTLAGREIVVVRGL